MSRPIILKFSLLVPILCLTFTIFSCNTTKRIKYFQDIPDSGKLKPIPVAEYHEPKIQVDDIITVLVQTIDPTTTQALNLGNAPSPATASLAGAPNLNQLVSTGYLVNNEGDIDLPVLGKIHVAGSTTSEAREIVKKIAEKYYKDISVIVRFSNFKVNVVGEVLKPGQYILPNEKVTILDAIAMAGDLTIFGKRENVLLIRENLDGTKTSYRINLKKSDIMSSPYYYLHQNDVIYVEPRKAKSDATDASQTKYITLAGAILSIILVLAYRVK